MKRSLINLGGLWVAMTTALAAEFYIDPVRGDPAHDGSAAHPWRSLSEVIDAGLVQGWTWDARPHGPGSTLVARHPDGVVRAGDTLWLRTGDHGNLVIHDHYNTDFITVAAEEGQAPQVRSIHLRSASHWVLRGLRVRPESEPGEKPGTLVELRSHGWGGPLHDVVVENCEISSAEDTTGWTADEWNTRAWSGILGDGAGIVVRGNRVRNVNFGISVSGPRALVEHNVVENFSGDGLRGLGNHGVFQHNLVKNCYDVNDNHDDGFQSWSDGPQGVGTGEVVGMVLRGNTIINYEDPAQPHRGTLQGIGCFDGLFVDWVVENNVVLVDHWHGITLLGARGCRITNNTVIDLTDGRPGPPWIRVAKHKNGTPARDCIVRNNLTPSLSVEDGPGMQIDHNLIVDDPDTVFVDVARQNLRLREDSPARNAGSSDAAPETDIVGTPRPQGDAIDVGAYERERVVP